MEDPFAESPAAAQAHPIDAGIRAEILRRLAEVYRQDARFVRRLREVAAAVHQPVRAFHHYHAMGRGNFRDYLQGERVRAKKYLYVLRPLLAARWVLARPDAPPMAFESLVRELVDDPAVRREIDELLVLKRRSGELEWLPSRPVLHAFLGHLLQEPARSAPPDVRPPLGPLDDLLAETVLGAAAGPTPGSGTPPVPPRS